MPHPNADNERPAPMRARELLRPDEASRQCARGKHCERGGNRGARGGAVKLREDYREDRKDSGRRDQHRQPDVQLVSRHVDVDEVSREEHAEADGEDQADSRPGLHSPVDVCAHTLCVAHLLRWRACSRLPRHPPLHADARRHAPPHGADELGDEGWGGKGSNQRVKHLRRLKSRRGVRELMLQGARWR